ncbi:hypothetical protein BWI17_03505 [Betaproteobacteria bacterium GR16-43]|nr:hypothetical protein BWI17_03505 [Betaproteobacteria bacterium GR16-43]
MVRADLADLSLEQLSNVVVTSVSRREERLADAPASIYVITSQEIRASGATTLPEALRLAPNLDVARADAVQYAISARGFNNVLANKMLVLIDGRTVYTPLFSGVFWEAQDVLLRDVERIEVISGPGGTLWGANAMNGVINVITKSARDTQGLDVSIGSGNRETSGGARFGGAFAGGYYRFYAKSADRSNSENAAGSDIRDSSQLMQAGFRADWDDAQRTFTIQADAYDGSVDQIGPSREISGANALVRYARKLSDGGRLHVQAYYDRTDRFHPNTFKETLETADLELQHAFKVGMHQLVWGGGYRRSRDEIDNYPSQAFLPDRKTLAWTNLFVQDQLSLGSQVDLTIGLKAEHNTYSGQEWLPSARLAWRPANDRLAWAALSRAIRAPSRIDRDYYQPGQPPYAITGNETFESEVANVAELGYRATLTPSLSYSATAFYSDYDKLRSVGPGNGALILRNDLEGTEYGIEAWGRWQVVPSFALSGGFVAMHQKIELAPGTVDFGGRAALGNDPDGWMKLRAAWTVTRDIDLDVFLRYYAARPNPAVPSYTAVDARVAWRVTPAFELSLALQNLFDDKHAEWGVDPARPVFQRSAFFKATWRP